MSRERSYADDSYGSVFMIQAPIEVDVGDGTAGNVASYTTTVALEIVEVGIQYTEAVLDDATAAVISARVGTTDHIEHDCTDGAAIATSEGTTGTCPVVAGGTVIFYHKTKGDDSGTQSGKGFMYFMAREKFSAE